MSFDVKYCDLCDVKKTILITIFSTGYDYGENFLSLQRSRADILYSYSSVTHMGYLNNNIWCGNYIFKFSASVAEKNPTPESYFLELSNNFWVKKYLNSL